MQSNSVHLTGGAVKQAPSHVGELCWRRVRRVCGQVLPGLGRMSVTAAVMSSDRVFCITHISLSALCTGSLMQQVSRNTRLHADAPALHQELPDLMPFFSLVYSYSDSTDEPAQHCVFIITCMAGGLKGALKMHTWAAKACLHRACAAAAGAMRPVLEKILAVARKSHSPSVPRITLQPSSGTSTWRTWG